jgi:hypothetical protein
MGKDFKCDGCSGDFPVEKMIRATEKGQTKGRKAASEMENRNVDQFNPALGDALRSIKAPQGGEPLSLCSDCTHEMRPSINVADTSKLGPVPSYVNKIHSFYKSDLSPGQSLNDLKKAKIFDLKSKKMVANLDSTGQNTMAPKSTGKAPKLSSVAPKKAAPVKPKEEPAQPKFQGNQELTSAHHPEGAFALKIRGGHLVGKANPPGEHSPCPECIHRHLGDRQIYAEPMDLKSAPKRLQPHIETVKGKDHDPHTFFEVNHDGESTKLNTHSFSHPDCKSCDKAKTTEPKDKKNLSYPFSHIQELVTSRYSLPTGNKWLARSTTKDGETGYAVASEREDARTAAVHAPIHIDDASHKNPMHLMNSAALPDGHKDKKDTKLIVGANSYLRDNMPFFQLQRADHHLLMHHDPKSNTHHVGVLSFARAGSGETSYSEHKHHDIHEAIKGAINKTLIASKPWDHEDKGLTPEKAPIGNSETKHKWLQNWLYKQPKVALKDVLSTPAKDQKLAKAKIIDFKSGKTLANLPTSVGNLVPAKAADPLIENGSMNPVKTREETNTEAMHHHLHHFAVHTKAAQALDQKRKWSAQNVDTTEADKDFITHYNLGKAHERKAREYYEAGVIAESTPFIAHRSDHMAVPLPSGFKAPKTFKPHASEKVVKQPLVKSLNDQKALEDLKKGDVFDVKRYAETHPNFHGSQQGDHGGYEFTLLTGDPKPTESKLSELGVSYTTHPGKQNFNTTTTQGNWKTIHTFKIHG